MMTKPQFNLFDQVYSDYLDALCTVAGVEWRDEHCYRHPNSYVYYLADHWYSRCFTEDELTLVFGQPELGLNQFNLSERVYSSVGIGTIRGVRWRDISPTVPVEWTYSVRVDGKEKNEWVPGSTLHRVLDETLQRAVE